MTPFALKEPKFGSVYIREDFFDRAEIERDVALMAEMGFSLVTLWPVANSWLTEDPAQFVFDDTRHFLDTCHRYGIQVILQAIGQNQSQEYMPDCRMRPDMLLRATDRKGAVGNFVNNFWANPNHPAVADAIREYLLACGHALRDHPAVFAWDVFNEAHLRADEPYTHLRFREWLAQRYSRIGSLNRLWHRRYSSFTEINPDDRNAGYSLWSSILPSVEYEQFLSENLTEHCRRWAAWMREADPFHPVLIDGTSALLLEKEIIHRNNDEWKTAHVCDIYGGTFYPKSWGHHFTETPWLLAAFFEMSASAARHAHKPFSVSELQTHTLGPLSPGSEVSPDELEAWMWSALAGGAKILQLWRQRPFLHGYQSTGRGITTLSGVPSPRSEPVRRLAASLRRNAHLLENAEPAASPVRLLVSHRARLFFDVFRQWQPSRQPDSVIGWFRFFWERGIAPEIVEVDAIDAIDWIAPIIVLPCLLSLSDELAQRLAEYVAQGGLLIGEARLNILDPWARVRTEGSPGQPLSRVFGVREIDVTSPAPFQLGEQWLTGGFLQQQLEVAPTAQVFLRSGSSGLPLLVGNKHGMGRALYASVILGEILAEKGSLDAFWSIIAEQAGVCLQAPLPTSARRLLQRLHQTPSGQLLYLVNYDTVPVTVTLPEGRWPQTLHGVQPGPDRQLTLAPLQASLLYQPEKT